MSASLKNFLVPIRLFFNGNINQVGRYQIPRAVTLGEWIFIEFWLPHAPAAASRKRLEVHYIFLEDRIFIFGFCLGGSRGNCVIADLSAHRRQVAHSPDITCFMSVGDLPDVLLDLLQCDFHQARLQSFVACFASFHYAHQSASAPAFV